MVRITALMDNEPSENKALTAEHGLSFLVEREGFRMLFDCGAGAAPWENARRLGRKVRGLDAVVLSHSHYDHAAGFRDLVEQGGGSAVLYTGPHFFEPKFAASGMRYTDLSAGFGPDFLAEHGIRRHVVEDVAELSVGVWLVAGFPRLHSFETIPDRFVRLTADGFVPDDFGDEVCLALEVGGRLAVLVGCSHPGILNMVERVHAALQKPVFAVFGGTHLKEADKARTDATVSRLRELGLELLGLSHCSGAEAERSVRDHPAVQGCHLAVGDCVFLA